jgi:hypothetical protein
LTKTFETEAEARDFAQVKFDSGLIVTAGTVNPHLPRRAIPSEEVPAWLQSGQAPEPNREDAHGPTTKTDPSSPAAASDCGGHKPCDR